ncbi:hypothetical protein TNCV_3988601 [Trichonephila clavipes]|nr:hypothetical protein TNCV_3988601 [Trichonephila clavipes]
MPSDCGAKVWSWSCQFRVVHRPPSIPQRRKFLPDRNEVEEVPHISISVLHYSLPLRCSPWQRSQDIESDTFEGCSNIVAMQLPRATYLWPSELNRHHRTCTTVPRQLTLPQQGIALELGAKFS